MKRLYRALAAFLVSGALVVGCSPRVTKSVVPPSAAPNSALDPALSALFAEARALGPLAMPRPQQHYAGTWGVKVPTSLYTALEKAGSRHIPRVAPPGAEVVVFLALPASSTRVPHGKGRMIRADGNCVLTVIGYQYPDHWEYAYSYLSGNCYFDSGPGGSGGGPSGAVGTPGPVPNCPIPSGGANTIVETAINGSARLKDLATFLANNRTMPSVKVNTTDIPPPSAGEGVDATADYARTPSQGTITVYTRALKASGHPLEQVLYHELLHYLFVYAQYDFGGENARSVLPQGGTATATFNGIQYTYDLSDHSPGGGYQSFEHVLVHDALVAAFGADATGALDSALNATKPPLSDADKKALKAAYANKKSDDTSIKSTIPTNQQCGVTKYPSGRSRAIAGQRSKADLIDDLAGVTFDSTYVVGEAATMPPPDSNPCGPTDAYGLCGWYPFTVTDFCDMGDGTSQPYTSQWIFRVYNKYSGVTTDFSGTRVAGAYCMVIQQSWQGADPQSYFGDPNFPGPYDGPI